MAAAVTGEADVAVVPLANSLEGPVGETVDALAIRGGYIGLMAEYRITLCLASNVENPRRLVTHPHAAAQARKLIAAMGLEVVYAPSTAAAAEEARRCGDCAALVSPAAAAGFRHVRCGVEDAESYTRFVTIVRSPGREGTHTSAIFTVPNRPGALYEALRPFAERGVNLSFIYSRPTRLSPWQYFFVLEAECGLQDRACSEAFEELGRRAATFRALGSYQIIRLGP